MLKICGASVPTPLPNVKICPIPVRVVRGRHPKVEITGLASSKDHTVVLFLAILVGLTADEHATSFPHCLQCVEGFPRNAITV